MDCYNTSSSRKWKACEMWRKQRFFSLPRLNEKTMRQKKFCLRERKEREKWLDKVLAPASSMEIFFFARRGLLMFHDKDGNVVIVGENLPFTCRLHKLIWISVITRRNFHLDYESFFVWEKIHLLLSQNLMCLTKFLFTSLFISNNFHIIHILLNTFHKKNLTLWVSINIFISKKANVSAQPRLQNWTRERKNNFSMENISCIIFHDLCWC